MTEQPSGQTEPDATEDGESVPGGPSVTNPDAESVDDAEHDGPGEGAATD